MIALIPDEDWLRGPNHIAGIIAGFEAATRSDGGDSERHPDLEPDSVQRILRYRNNVVWTTTSLNAQINGAVEKFSNDTGLNELPEVFASFPKISFGLGQVSSILRLGEDDKNVEDQLRAEIGRLRASVLELETALEVATKTTEPIFAPAIKRKVGESLGDWKLYGAIVAGLWILGSDEAGIQKRLENLGQLREQLFGDVCPMPEPQDRSASPIVET